MYSPPHYTVRHQKNQEEMGEKKNILMQSTSNFMVIFVQWDNLGQFSKMLSKPIQEYNTLHFRYFVPESSFH